MSLTHTVHPIYEVTFLWVDPVLSLVGFVMAFAVPEMLIEGWVPKTIPNPATPSGFPVLPNPRVTHHPEYNVMIHELGGFFFTMMLVFGVLLRHTRDPFVWQLIIGCVCFIDFIVLGSTAVQYRGQGRLHPAAWRWEDWFSVSVTAYVGFLRLAYMLGFGVGEKEKMS
ncbi:hypothetical protein B0I35DRAFT_482167 [Stachybotrys elegans]|uniref:DUF7704 domain-containing protein n=1 Tax=Stachybotrys elegans TaxID=80388 RepID=A0A8K0SQ59_9HYPO|nr:hypothetical protein B0I35DRAFT_482167 [Stachybotrys elegans]